MRTFQFTFQDVEEPARGIITTTEGLDERWALQAAVEQLKDTAGDYAWQLIATEEVTPEPIPEEDPTA